MSKSKNILVIGGAGYIGSHMVHTLRDEGYAPLVFDNLSTGHREFVPQGVPFIKGDLRKEGDIDKALKKYPVEAVMHFAALSIVPESVKYPLRYYDNNVLGCINLLNTMQKYNVNRFIFSSTAAVYGEPQAVPITEDALLKPTNPYGRSKLIVEKMLYDLVQSGSNLSYISLRYFNAAGAHPQGIIGEKHNPETHLIPNIIKAALGKKKELTIFGNDYPTKDGTCIRDYIHVMDLCRAHLLALKALKQGIENEAFNLGSGDGHSVKEIVDTAEAVTSKKIKVKVASRRPGDPPKLVAAYEKARKVLGWEPEYTIHDIIETAWQWGKR